MQVQVQVQAFLDEHPEMPSVEWRNRNTGLLLLPMAPELFERKKKKDFLQVRFLGAPEEQPVAVYPDTLRLWGTTLLAARGQFQ